MNVRALPSRRPPPPLLYPVPTAIRFVLAIAVAHVTHVCPAALAAYTDVQYSGLEALYNFTNGQSWTTSTGWRDSALGVCNWHGVTCDGDSGNVTGLSLSGNGLVGDVSEASELANVESLVEVDLSSNRLSGSVPLSFGLMPRLTNLDLSENELSFFSAAWGSGALALQHVSLQNNNISG